MRLSLAIVIPVGPGDPAWRELLPQLESVGALQIVLARARGETDRPEALSANVTLTASDAGRARQLNAGAAATGADWLWFLHSDSCIVASSVRALHRFIATEEAAIGYFDLRFRDDGPRLVGLNAVGAYLRSRWLGLPFGDQGFLMPRRTYDSLGGFDERLAGGEDHALVWAARRAGVPLRAVGAPIYTSARKYAQRGWWKTTREHVRLTTSQACTFSRKAPSS